MERPLPTARIGRYEVIRRIGAGGMGEVFLARAKGPGGITKQVCIKRTLPGRSMNPGAVDRFLDEARTAVSLQHANIVPVFEVGRDGGGLFLVMEWIDGCDLSALLAAVRARGEKLPEVVATYIAAEVCKALAYAHERTEAGRPAGILHRDVTPRNVLLSRLGEVRLTDFGIARAIGAAGAPTGTPAYMAPEAAAGQPDARSDLYSVGLVLGEMLAGPLGEAAARDQTRPVPIPPFDGVSAEVAAAAQRLLAPELADRFPSAAAALAALIGPLAAQTLRGGPPPARELASLVSHVAIPSEIAPRGEPHTEAGETHGIEPPADRSRGWWPLLLGLAVLSVALVTLAIARGRAPAPRAPLPPVASAPPPALPVTVRPAPPVPRPPIVASPAATRLRPARLRVTAPGSWVTTYVDDRKVGDDAGEFEIRPGRHRLRVENPPLHYHSEEWILAHPGETITREFHPAEGPAKPVGSP